MKKTRPKRPAKTAAQHASAKNRTATAPRTETTTPAPQDASKKAVVISLLRREGGATLADLMHATGWQAHSVRGFISGTLRKKLGLTVEHIDGKVGPAYRVPE